MPTKSKSLTTTKHGWRRARGGAVAIREMLREEFMKPLGLSANALAMELRVRLHDFPRLSASGAELPRIQRFGWPILSI